MEDDENNTSYKPFDLFAKKHSGEELNEHELRILWIDLKDKKKLKFINKAAKIFDDDHESIEITKDDCFSSHLTRDEQNLLIKSYNFPDKVPDTLRGFYISKYGEGITNPQLISQNLEKLTQEEKEDLMDEYLTVKEEYYKNYVEFLNQIPKSRFIDYRQLIKNPTEKTRSKKKKPKIVVTTDLTTANKKSIKARELLHPFEFYLNDHHSKFIQGDKSLHVVKMEAKNEFKTLDAAKRLKYIKLSEKAYDELENPKKELTELLMKDEAQLLFESYGLPSKVIHKQFYNQYVVNMMAKYPDVSFGDRSKLISEDYKRLSESESKALRLKHQNDLDEYNKKIEKFKKNLPSNRVVDYERHIHRDRKDKRSKPSKQPRSNFANETAIEESVIVDRSDEEDFEESSNCEELNGYNSPKKQKLK